MKGITGLTFVDFRFRIGLVIKNRRSAIVHAPTPIKRIETKFDLKDLVVVPIGLNDPASIKRIETSILDRYMPLFVLA